MRHLCMIGEEAAECWLVAGTSVGVRSKFEAIQCEQSARDHGRPSGPALKFGIRQLFIAALRCTSKRHSDRCIHTFVLHADRLSPS
jgi:hypothetical protein